MEDTPTERKMLDIAVACDVAYHRFTREQVTELRDYIARLEAENAAMREAFSKLPRTEDGKAILPGMPLYKRNARTGSFSTRVRLGLTGMTKGDTVWSSANAALAAARPSPAALADDQTHDAMGRGVKHE